MQPTEASPLARLILFTICLSLAGLFAALILAGTLSHGAVSDVQPPGNFGTCEQENAYECMSRADIIGYEECIRAKCPDLPSRMPDPLSYYHPRSPNAPFRQEP